MRLVTLGLALALCGCSKTVTMVYHTQPEGAVVYQSGREMGISPVTVKYPAPPSFNAGGCASFGPTSARWASGAQTDVPDVTACREKTYLQHVTLQRPDVAGLDVDMAAAANRQPSASAPTVQEDDDSDDLLYPMLISSSSRVAPSATYRASPNPVTTPPPIVTPTTNPFRRASPPVTFNSIGRSVYGSDGSTATTIGNATYYNNGVVDQHIGNMTFGSDGYNTNRIGNTTYDNKGTTFQQIGNTVYGSDGSTCQAIGNQVSCR